MRDIFIENKKLEIRKIRGWRDGGVDISVWFLVFSIFLLVYSYLYNYSSRGFDFFFLFILVKKYVIYMVNKYIYR